MHSVSAHCVDAQARRSGRSGASRGLATQLEGMQAQLADLDAMWAVVNAPKSQATSVCEVGRQCTIIATVP